jgi:hypothetical protein
MPRAWRSFRRWLAASACGLALLGLPAVAHADPISATAAAIVAAIGVTGTAATIATFVITTALRMATAYALSKLTGPKRAQQERQASVTTLSIGESAREVAFGRVCSGGSLVAAANFGGEYGTDWEVLEIALADHEIDGLEGFYIGADFYPYTGNGLQSGFSNCLDLEFVNASDDVAPPARFAGAAGMGDLDRLRGVAKVWAAYKANDKVWPQGRPSFKWLFRGKRCYDARKDSTVPGGDPDGDHRWNAPSTWEWSENVYVCRYNWLRGVFALDQVDKPEMLLVGRGLSEIEAPPENVFAPANVCDELVALKAGGSEARYRCAAVIRADETFDTTEQMFAAAMAGVIVQREGGVEIEPGQAKSTVVEITDADLVIGETVTFDRFLPAPDRVNTVIGRYVEPAQGWSDHAAPVRRSVVDIEDDGGPNEATLSLGFVTSGTQGQRCAEAERRLGRMERRATIPLGPRFSGLEEGDWIGWTSDRWHQGGRVVYRVEAWSSAASGRMTLALREIASSAFSWNAAVDEIVPGTAPPPEPARPDPLGVAGAVITIGALVGEDGSSSPAIRATWATPVDPALQGLRLEVRVAGEADVTPTTITAQDALDRGVLVTDNGVAASATLEARLVPLTDPSREIQPSDWTEVVSGPSTASGATVVPWSGVQDDDGQRPEDGADVTANHTAGNTAFVGEKPAGEVVSDLVTNAEQILAEILRGAVARAYIDARTYLDGVLIGTVLTQEIENRITADEAYAALLSLLGAKNGDASAWIMAASVVLASSGHTLGSFIEYVESTLGDGTVSITELKEAIDGAYGRWAVSVQSLLGGTLKAIGGIEVTVDGVTETSAVNFIADYYRFVRLDGTSPVYLLTYDEANDRWTFGADLYAQKIVADSIDTIHLRVGGVITNRIADHNISDNEISGASSTVYGTGSDVTLFEQEFELDNPARVRAEGDVAFLDGGGNGPSYHQSRLRLLINGTQVNLNDAGGVVATSVLAITGALEVAAGTTTVTLMGMTKPDDYYTYRNLFTEWFYK